MEERTADFVVVGTGAGGGVVGYHLARAGERVILVERGRRVGPEEMGREELEALATLYKDGGAQMNRGLSMTVLQGHCVGGSTVLANMVCFRLPEAVRQTYANHGFELPWPDLARSYERVESVLNVHETPESLLNPAALRLERGMQALGIEGRRFRHASMGCNGCGYCNLGCRYGAKMDSSRTWIPMAEKHGAVVMARVEALRLEVRKGQVTSLLCRDLDQDRLVRIRARRYVLSGGAINTPELMLRSGILRDRVGHRTSMNAGAMMLAEYPDPLDAFRGIQMGVYHEEDGYTIEQDHNPYLSFCMTQPIWLDREMVRRPDRYRHMTSCGVLAPTRPVGRVRLNPLRRVLRRSFHRAELDFHMPDEDRLTMVRGYKQLARIYLASGARSVYAPTHQRVVLRRAVDVDRLDAALADPRAISGLGTAHPQGGAPLGDDARRDVLDPGFRVRGLDNLFVMDASVFPSSMGVNPVLTIMAVADHAVRFIADVRPPEVIDEGPAHAMRLAVARRGAAEALQDAS